MEDMAKRTTIILSPDDERALREAARREGLSQSELIRKGIRTVTAAYRRRTRPSFGWLKLSASDRREIDEDRLGDREKK